MDAKTKRKHLNDFKSATRDIELTPNTGSGLVPGKD